MGAVAESGGGNGVTAGDGGGAADLDAVAEKQDGAAGFRRSLERAGGDVGDVVGAGDAGKESLVGRSVWAVIVQDGR